MQLTLPILLGIALADSVNPVSFGVLLNLLRKTSQNEKSIQSTETNGWQYVISFLATYIGIGLVLLVVFNVLGAIQPGFFSFLGAIILLLGILELNRITDYSKNLNRFTSQPHQRIETYTKNLQFDPAISLALGITTAIKEVFYSGGFYLSLLGLLSIQRNFDTFTLIFFYNAIIALPLVILVLLVKNNVSTKEFELWHTKKRRPMMIGIATLQIVMGIWLMFWWFV